METSPIVKLPFTVHLLEHVLVVCIWRESIHKIVLVYCICRYDVRAHLLDVSGESPESSDSEEEMIEKLCDEERYLALKTDVVKEEEQEGMKGWEWIVCLLWVFVEIGS